MKKYLPYIAGGLLLLVLIGVVWLAPIRVSRQFDERITLRQQDKIPYGTYAAYQLLPSLFPAAAITTHDVPPEGWANMEPLPKGEAIVLTARYFDPSNLELRTITRYLQAGNYVFIITNSLSGNAASHFGVSSTPFGLQQFDKDSLRIQLSNPPFQKSGPFLYPGKRFDSFFDDRDKARSFVLGRDAQGNPNFVQLQSGKGKLFIHLAPLAFSNYFILHKKNVAYFENVFSLLPATVTKISWNEYYLKQRNKRDDKEPNALSVLWQYPSFKWALLTAVATLLLYMLAEARRRQRLIPVVKPPVNDSVSFVRTLGRLYYDKGDHHNLANKMATYFAEHVRTTYHLQTENRDAHFVTELHARSGFPLSKLQEIVFFIDALSQTHFITEAQLGNFYEQLESFYQYSGNGRTTF